MRRIIKNKKGQSLFDIIVFMVILTLLVVGFVMFKYVFHTATVQLHNMNMPTTVVNMTQVTDQTFGYLDTGFNSLRYIALAIFFGMIINILVSNFLIKTNPAFWFLYVGVTILGIILAVFISNSYYQIASNPTFASTFSSFTEVDFAMNYLPAIVTVIGLMGALFLFIGIPRDSGQGGF